MSLQDWQKRLDNTAESCSFEMTSRWMIDAQGQVADTEDLREVIETRVHADLVAGKDYYLPNTAAAYENWKLGEWIDSLAETDPEQLQRIKNFLSSEGSADILFRHWWNTFIPADQLLQGLQEHGHYFDISAEEFGEQIAQKEPKDFPIVRRRTY